LSAIKCVQLIYYMSMYMICVPNFTLVPLQWFIMSYHQRNTKLHVFAKSITVHHIWTTSMCDCCPTSLRVCNVVL